MAFQQGLSGLNAASKALDVISNNVSNTSNVGFKQASAQFKDVFSVALNGGAAGVQVGVGTAIGAVSQTFSQGSITPTDNPLDVAINGAGFFRMTNNGSLAYTRNGQFDVDKDGFIVNSAGYQLTGYPANAAGVILPATPTPIQIDTADLLPKQSTSVLMGMNLDSGAVAPAAAFNAANPATYNSSTSVTLFDTLGNSHVMTLYMVKTGAGAWDVHTQLDGGTTALTGSIAFNTAGQLTTAMPLAVTGLTVTTGASSPIGGAGGVALDLTGTTQYGSLFGVNSQSQDGYTSGRLSGTSISGDGTVQGRYSNGQSRNLAQVVLVNFASPNGLVSTGGNLWVESPESGQPLLGAPGSGSLGVLQAGSVEESNVDLTAELVNMMTQQRNYQANAQSIKTEDQVMQTLVNLR